MEQDILDMLNLYYDAYKEDYMSMYGTETNNYLFIDSDLELHIEQESPHHIFVALFTLGKKVGWNEEELAMELEEE